MVSKNYKMFILRVLVEVSCLRGLQLHPDDGMGTGRHSLVLLLFHDLQALGNHLIINKTKNKQ